MLKKAKYFYIILFGLLLVSCKQQSREAYLIRHQTEFQAIMRQCGASQAAMRTKECIFVTRLYKQEIRLVRQLAASPAQYGKDILSLQVKQGVLQEKILQVKEALQQPNITAKKRTKLNQRLQEYQNQIDNVTRQIEIRLALLAVTERM